MPLDYFDPTTQERFYDVEKSVGLGSVNLNDDVKLVQYMLNRIYAKGFATPPAKPMVVDGWIGPVTVEWIKRFQMDVNAKGYMYAATPEYQNPAKQRCVVDGCRGDGLASVSQLPYTILWMNTILKKLDPAAHATVSSVVPCKKSALFSRPNPYNDPKPTTTPTVAGGF